MDLQKRILMCRHFVNRRLYFIHICILFRILEYLNAKIFRPVSSVAVIKNNSMQQLLQATIAFSRENDGDHSVAGEVLLLLLSGATSNRPRLCFDETIPWFRINICCATLLIYNYLIIQQINIIYITANQ